MSRLRKAWEQINTAPGQCRGQDSTGYCGIACLSVYKKKKNVVYSKFHGVTVFVLCSDYNSPGSFYWFGYYIAQRSVFWGYSMDQWTAYMAIRELEALVENCQIPTGWSTSQNEVGPTWVGLLSHQRVWRHHRERFVFDVKMYWHFYWPSLALNSSTWASSGQLTSNYICSKQKYKVLWIILQSQIAF